MKLILTAAVILSLGRGAYAADFSELAVKAAGLETPAAMNDAGKAPGVNPAQAVPVAREDKGPATSCQIKDGEAVGVIRNISSGVLSYGGSVSFYFYNAEGAMIDENLAMASGTIPAYKSGTLINRGIPLRAESCGLDISAAKPVILPAAQNVPPAGGSYTVSCQIKGGDAVGVIRNLSTEALRYGGSVSFYFYDDNGAMIDENLTMASGAVRPGENTALINSGIPLRAKSCGMDISSIHF